MASRPRRAGIFTSDNGGDYRYGGSNKPFRGQKAELFEGGIRLPCLMRWPGKIKAGRVTDQPVIGLDSFPTFCSIAGISNSRSVDGTDISPVIFEEAIGSPARSVDRRIF